MPLRVPPRQGQLRTDSHILATPSRSADAIRSVAADEWVEVIGFDSGFAMVDLGDGAIGYVAEAAIGEYGAPRISTKYYAVRPTSSSRQQEVIEYESRYDFEVDRPEWLSSGWRIASVTDLEQRAGCARIFFIGFLALLWRPEPHVRVVYERDGSTSATTATTETPQTSAAATAPVAGATGGIAAEIERLAELKERGVLTDEEFVQAKRRLLDGGG